MDGAWDAKAKGLAARRASLRRCSIGQSQAVETVEHDDDYRVLHGRQPHFNPRNQ